jgi:hypothetical protein
MSTSGQEQNTESLQLADLQNLLVIIDIACQRGAFKGPELSQVGSVFDRVSKFLKSVEPKNEQPVQQPEQPQQAPLVTPVPSPMTTASTPPFSLLGGNY